MNRFVRHSPSETETVVSDEARHNQAWFFTLGVVLIALGIATMVFPFAAEVPTGMLIGAVLLISGASQTLHALRAHRWKGCLLALLGGVLALVVGTVMLVYSEAGILYLNLLVATFLAAMGMLRIFLALQLRPNDNWSWLMGSGVLALMVAAVILPQWPQGSGWIFSLLVGIDLLFAGWASITLAGAASRNRFQVTAAAE